MLQIDFSDMVGPEEVTFPWPFKLLSHRYGRLGPLDSKEEISTPPAPTGYLRRGR